MNTVNKIFLLFIFLLISISSNSQLTDAAVPLHEVMPDYKIDYGNIDTIFIKNKTKSILSYLDKVTPVKLIDLKGNEISDYKSIDENTNFLKGDFRLISYEWGVVYGAMIYAGNSYNDDEFKEYTRRRINFIKNIANIYKNFDLQKIANSQIKSLLDPHALDDAGSMGLAMIKSKLYLNIEGLDNLIKNSIDFIMNKEYRLPDGTFARNRPHKNTIWLDDLYMSVPAIAWMGKLTNDKKYFDEAVKQVISYYKILFDTNRSLFIHGKLLNDTSRPGFCWGRANGWAILAITELLEVLPENHPGYNTILNILKQHINGIVKYQSGEGLWHQLLDKNDTYLETSASAIFTYAIARAINKGFISGESYGPCVIASWNALSKRINDKGQIEGTCVGTGLGFDPVFYYYRPVSVYAAHGYGPMILAASEIYNLIKNYDVKIVEKAIIIYKK